MREIREIKQLFIKAIIIMIVAPFVAIPVIVILLKLLIWAMGLLNCNELIVLRIDMESIISVGDFINYYCAFLGIETAAYLSYRVYVLTITRYEYEDKEKFEKNKRQLIVDLKAIRQKTHDATKPYSEERGGSKWSFYELLEVKQQNQFTYSTVQDEFNGVISAKELYQIETIKDYVEGSEEVEQLVVDIKDIYKGLEIISKHFDINQIEDATFFHGYQAKITSVLDALDLFIEKLR